MAENKIYSKRKAFKRLKKFVKLTNYDINIQSRRAYEVRMRSLLCVVLKEKNGMLDYMISDFLAINGVDLDRSSIFTAIKRADYYYLNFKDYRDFYDIYFSDRMPKSEAVKVKADKNIIKDELHYLIQDLPTERRSEVLDSLIMKVKSWDWKSVDDCKTYDCSAKLETF